MFNRAWSGVVLALAVAAQAACVSAPRRAVGAGIDTVTEEEIDAMRATSAYDVVARTHAEYLHSRGRQSLDSRMPAIPAHVYVDDTFYGEIDTLKAIPASQLAEVRFFQGYEAQYRFGSGHMGGVVQLITKR
jgi:outer membrane cobalamin receptor